MPLTRSLSNSAKQNDKMQLVIQDKIEVYLERKFRTSRSFATRNSYRIAINRFVDFVRIHYSLDFSALLSQIKESRDPIDVLDDYYSHLSEGEKRLRNSSICLLLYRSKGLSKQPWMQDLLRRHQTAIQTTKKNPGL